MSLICILDEMTFFLHGLLVLSRRDHRASLRLALFCLASLNFDGVSLLASVRLFPRPLQSLYKTRETEIRQTIVVGKNKQGPRYTIPSLCLEADLITDIILLHVYYFATEGIAKSHFLHSETPLI